MSFGSLSHHGQFIDMFITAKVSGPGTTYIYVQQLYDILEECYGREDVSTCLRRSMLYLCLFLSWTLLTACFSHEATGHLLVNGMSFWYVVVRL